MGSDAVSFNTWRCGGGGGKGRRGGEGEERRSETNTEIFLKGRGYLILKDPSPPQPKSRKTSK